ncbi:Cys-tRNA(Pro)/Cys-tRNA(Cys) deacylase YbaK [Oxobacter pfennigii]|uniref:Cys-tRNA(Pro)/Cys-tRNA(Cys) deacylase YbaK n=1 Tax=Oxobacter pfennigii TaxID=36849 RepID=A0A0P8WDT1_9CLOT|nr:YbaK/EbsC family protein [Oxobacter pfennigii]KPU46174.1 Cys-tRNA(Pro)/Cys-tRNA(Cys) deacylase YbaK [Oxobacter pfennigii]
MGTKEVRQFFLERSLPDPVFELSDSGATVDLASKTLGVEPGLIAKTLAFKLKDRNILIVMSGNCRIDNKKFKQYFGIKAKMLEHDEVSDITGHPVGGLTPFGLKNGLEIYLDISIKEFKFVYPAAGSKTAALKISPSLMQELTDAIWVDICQ